MSFFSNYTNDQQIGKQLELIENRVGGVEDFFGLICSYIGSINRNSAKCRDKGDLIARELNNFATTEKINESARLSLLEFARNYSCVQDYLHVKVERVRTNAIEPLSKYKKSCVETKRNIRSSFLKIRKKLQTKNQLLNFYSQSDLPHYMVSKAEKTKEKMTRLCGNLEEMAKGFEKKKLVDLKSVLKNFVASEIEYSSKALQFYTECFKDLESFDVEKDLENFQKQLKNMLSDFTKWPSDSSKSLNEPLIKPFLPEKRNSSTNKDTLSVETRSRVKSLNKRSSVSSLESISTVSSSATSSSLNSLTNQLKSTKVSTNSKNSTTSNKRKKKIEKEESVSDESTREHSKSEISLQSPKKKKSGTRKSPSKSFVPSMD